VTSARIAGRFAIVITAHRTHVAWNGVSPGDTGYGFCAYASSRARASFIPCMNATGDIPDGVCRGDVTPPATTFAELAWWSDA